MIVPDTAVVVGLPASLLSSCSAQSIPCKAILVPTLGDVPDPEGAAIVLDSLNGQVTTLGIDISKLREEGEEIKVRL